MNYNIDMFDYGDWSDAWFIKNIKPCMLKYDGTVDYELSKNDYSKKIDGISTSDYNNPSYEGNVMVGIPTVYFKIEKNENIIKFLFSNKNIDGDYKCYAHLDSNGNVMKYTYMPAYNGSLIDNKLRSISSQPCMANQTGTDEIVYAKANNLNNSKIWYTEVFSDRQLINMLLMLIGKSTDSQTVFGNGNIKNNGTNNSASELLQTGTMNSKGLFWGNNSATSKIGVKVFGIENWWGNECRRIAGYISYNGVQKVKLCYGQQDNSTVDGYNAEGEGYVTIPDATFTSTSGSGGYISECTYGDFGIIPVSTNGTSTTYYCDGLWFNNITGARYALVGGGCHLSINAGTYTTDLNNTISATFWGIGASLSCKPLV